MFHILSKFNIHTSRFTSTSGVDSGFRINSEPGIPLAQTVGRRGLSIQILWLHRVHG